VTRYATKSAEAADENQRRVEAVFAELAGAKPDNGTPRSGAPQATVRIRCASAGDCVPAGPLRHSSSELPPHLGCVQRCIRCREVHATQPERA
jgi:hypothetical protein